MSDQFPVTHSILSVAALLAYVRKNYALEQAMECKLLHRGLNDTFLVHAENAKYILRVYRAGWRSISDIGFELEALLHLRKADLAVSIPLMKRDGEYTGRIVAPEGERFLVLFTYASGNIPAYENDAAQEAYLYGRLAAQIHSASNTFRSSCDRFILDFSYLADTPLHSIKPMLSNRPKDWEYVAQLTERLREGIQSIPPTALETGFCHGDFHGGNAHLDSDSTLTFFDFDCCGMGWRSYDIAVFLWGARLRGKDKEQWPPFLKGYTEVSHLSDTDMHAVDYFVAIRHIWLMGLHTSRGHDWGFGWMNDGYFDRQISFLRKWETEYLTEKST